MQIKDVTLPVYPGIPVWPGDEEVKLYRQQKIEDGNNANGSFLGCSVHTGTHIDAPFHFLQDGYSVERIPMDQLIGEVQVIEFPDSIRSIGVKELASAGIQLQTSRLLFKTSNSLYWEKGEQKFQKDFVALENDGAEWLVDKGIRTVGIDYLSIAPFSRGKQTHETLLKSEILIIEGLNLSGIEGGVWNLICLPLKLNGAEGSPARVILTRE
jgi:arylformamidase